jgi:hypothetical protein
MVLVLQRAGVAALCLGIWAGTARAAEYPPRVTATYEVKFNGINVGTFDFASAADGQSYTLNGSGKFSALLGALTWTGQTQSTGKIVAEAPKPQSFAFDFKANSKVGSTRMGFTGDTVTAVQHQPPPKEKPGIIPVQEQHLKGVLDPMSAILALSRTASANPCGRRLPIYDGKQRFDLLLTYRGQTQVAERAPSGQPGVAYVCRVKYMPIAGHKADQETRFMATNDQIEVALRPIPSANIFVPYQISIPTIAGSAVLIAKRIEIVTAGGQQQIALVH